MFPQPSNYNTNGNSGVPPVLGGTVAALKYNFTKATTTAATVAFTVPSGASILSFGLVVDTAFDGSATLSVGTTGSNAYYLSAASALGSLGPVYSTAWLTSGKWNTRLAVDTPVTVTLGGSATVGSAYLVVYYAMI